MTFALNRLAIQPWHVLAFAPLGALAAFQIGG
jgi:hypothetical protein